jgi:hypothetical protein
MEHGCEHTEGSPIGKCAICEKTVCSECYREVFNAMICDLHQELEDESNWALVGFYNDSDALAERRYILEDSGITSLFVEVDDEAIELYVPSEEKEDAFSSLEGSGVDIFGCRECQIQYTKELSACPLCGTAPAEADTSQIH